MFFSSQKNKSSLNTRVILFCVRLQCEEIEHRFCSTNNTWKRTYKRSDDFFCQSNSIQVSVIVIKFYINNNILISLGDSIGNLENLYFLDLGYNKLTSIPESICDLENLTYLWLFNNNLESLPDCFCDMGLDWNNNDMGGYPYFAIGANSLCDSVTTCVSESDNFELSLDQFYYSFLVEMPQYCED